MGTKKLRRSISVPSTVHAYSLSLEYIKQWFFSKFDDDYFKAIYIDQRHVLDDFRNTDRRTRLKTMKPSVSITPVINFEYNRDLLDQYGGGLDLYIRRHNFNDSFLKDPKNNIYLSMRAKQLEVTYNFRLRVSTRAQQIDLYEYINMALSMGETKSYYIACDFHIPYSIMLQIAKDLGYCDENDNIINIIEFVSYLNQHCAIPITYKLRTINGNNEFFLRLEENLVHISCLDLPNADDGELENMVRSNYMIDFSITVKFSAPKFYVYYSENEHTTIRALERKGDNIGLYNIYLPTIPEYNSKGWQQYLVTSYCADVKGERAKIEFEELFKGSEVEKILNYTKKMYISPDIFMEFLLFENGRKIDFIIDWDNYIIETKEPISTLNIDISIYIDINYMKDRIYALEDLNKKRIKK